MGGMLNDRMKNKGIRKQSRRKRRESERKYEYENSIKTIKLQISHGRGLLEISKADLSGCIDGGA